MNSLALSANTLNRDIYICFWYTANNSTTWQSYQINWAYSNTLWQSCTRRFCGKNNWKRGTVLLRWFAVSISNLWKPTYCVKFNCYLVNFRACISFWGWRIHDYSYLRKPSEFQGNMWHASCPYFLPLLPFFSFGEHDCLFFSLLAEYIVPEQVSHSYILLPGWLQQGKVVVIRGEGPKGGPGMPEMLTPTSAIMGAGLGKVPLSS